MININCEHPEYIARKAMWKQYRGPLFRRRATSVNASDYLVVDA